MSLGRQFAWAAAVPLLSAAPVTAEPAEIPTLSPVWTIASPDCTGVDADAEPWLECGFQAFDARADLTRFLTVSANDRVQLWDGDGREVAAIAWRDEAGGASGFPTGKALISPSAAVAVVHQNQLLVLNPDTGAERLRKALPFRSVDLLQLVGANFALIEFKDSNLYTHYGALDLTTGELVREFDGLITAKTSWAAGVAVRKGKVVLLRNDDAMTEVSLERSCVPVGANGLCAALSPDGRKAEILDTSSGLTKSAAISRRGTRVALAEWAAVDDQLFALLCEEPRSADANPRQCRIMAVDEGRTIFEFSAKQASFVKPIGHIVTDSHGLRVAVSTETKPFRAETRVLQVSTDGEAKEVFRTPTYYFLAGSDGGFQVLENPERNWTSGSILLDAAGAPRARLDSRFRGMSVSVDGAHFSTAVMEQKPSRQDGFLDEDHTGLALFRFPPAPEALK